MSGGEPRTGMMIGIPIYPLYTAIIAEFGAVPVSCKSGVLSAKLNC